MPMRSSTIRLRFVSLASWRRAMRMILGAVRGGLAALAKRLVKLAPRFVLSSFPIHRARHLLDRARQGLHLVAQSFDVEEQHILRPRELVDGRAQACELVAHTGQGRLGGEVDGLRWEGGGHGRKPRSRWRGKFHGHRRERETRVALRSPKAGLRDERGMIDASGRSFVRRFGRGGIALARPSVSASRANRNVKEGDAWG